MSNIYINSIKQISAQQPLVDDWFEHPVFYSEPYIRSIEPDYTQFFTPNEARRYGKILKRALIVSRQVMSESGVLQPDAIITGTGLGCIEYTKIFLDKLVREGEELLNPTYFMQSTHNTISSLVAIDAKCHAYNNTYSHKGISFECAIQDAFLQLKHNKALTALVGAHDEMIPVYYLLLKKTNYLGKPNQVFAGETAVAMMLSTEKTEKTLCEIEAVEKFYTGACQGGLDPQSPEIMKVKMTDKIDYIMVGTNGDEENDKVYFENCAKLFPGIPLLQYKNVFGENYTAPALGFYAAALCLQRGQIPDFLMCNARPAIRDNLKSQISNPKSKILCYNHFEGKNHTFILLSK